MSWFDAASFTSYAKTALASAQKSIDKVLDIDEGTTNTTQNKKSSIKGKDESTESVLSNTEKTSRLKPQTTKPSKSNISNQKDSSKKSTSVEEGGDFWSSFLGSSSSSSSLLTTTSTSLPASSSSMEKMSKASSASIKCDIKTEPKKADDNEKNFEKSRRKRREVRGNKSSKETTKNENKETNKEQNAVGCKKDTPRTLETTKFSITKPECENQSEKSSSGDSLEQQLLDQSFVSVEYNTPCDTIKNEKILKSGKVGGHNSDEEITSVNNLVNDGGNMKTVIDERECVDERDFKSQKEGTEIHDFDTEDIEKVKQEENVESLALMIEESEFYSVAEGSKDNDIVSRNIESLLQGTPLATSTPCTGKGKSSMSSTDRDFRESAYGNDIDVVKKACETKEKSMSVDVSKEQGDVVKKEPVEDECVGEEVIIGSMYMGEDSLCDKEENIIGNDENDGVMNTKKITTKISSEREPTETSLVMEERGSDDDNVKVTGVIADAKDFKIEEEKESPLSEESSEAEAIAVQEKGNEGQSSVEVQALLKEVSSLKELVNARESKMVALSKENIDLQETNAILRSQLAQLENVHKVEDEEFEEMKEEFITRIAATENKLHETSKERDDLKMELEEKVKDLTAINERLREELTTLVSEKDEQIAQLLAEGEKLSRQELQSNTIIKKLRAKEKENDSLIKKQIKKLEDYEDEVKRLTEILTSRDDSNSKQEDAIIKLNAYVKKQEEQLNKQTSELEDANEKVRSMQVALDNAYKEMTSLQKQAASSDSSIQEAVLSAEMKAKEELRIALEKSRREYGQDSELMALQVADLQASLSRAEKQGTRREESLRQEISDLQQRIQEAEDRNQDLAASVSHATRPLLRQIENLQATHSGQASTWEMVEKNLTERLNEAQSQLLVAQDKERLASQNVSELNGRLTRLESQVNSYRAERARLEAELEIERTKSASVEDTYSREAAKSDAMLKKYKKMIEEVNLDKAHLEQQLAVEKSRMETELKKVKSALENKERLLSRQSSLSSFPPSSPSAYSESDFNDQTDDPKRQKSHVRKTSSGSSVADGMARGVLGGTTELIERLQAQVRQKDGEIELLQDEVTSLRQSRDSVMEELTKTTSKLDRLETNHGQLTDIKAKYDGLQQHYNAVLQMYGEKEEEAEELRMDLQDVKSMYKQQLEQLLGSTR